MDIAVDGIISQKTEGHDHLDAEFYQIGENVGNRHRQSREIDFSKHSSVCCKCLCIACKWVWEEPPDGIAAKIEKHLWDSIRAHASDTSENKRVNHAAEDRADNKPTRSKNGLLVLDDERALGEKKNQIPISPNFF